MDEVKTYKINVSRKLKGEKNNTHRKLMWRIITQISEFHVNFIIR